MLQILQATCVTYLEKLRWPSSVCVGITKIGLKIGNICSPLFFTIVQCRLILFSSYFQEVSDRIRQIEFSHNSKSDLPKNFMSGRQRQGKGSLAAGWLAQLLLSLEHGSHCSRVRHYFKNTLQLHSTKKKKKHILTINSI